MYKAPDGANKGVESGDFYPVHLEHIYVRLHRHQRGAQPHISYLCREGRAFQVYLVDFPIVDIQCKY